MSSGPTHPWHRWIALAIAVFSVAMLVVFFLAVGETNAAKQALDEQTPFECVRSIAGSYGTDGMLFPGKVRFVGANTIEVEIADVDKMRPADRPPADRVRCRLRFVAAKSGDPLASVVSAEWVR